MWGQESQLEEKLQLAQKSFRVSFKMQPCWEMGNEIAVRCSITVAKQEDLCSDTSCSDEAELKLLTCSQRYVEN